MFSSKKRSTGRHFVGTPFRPGAYRAQQKEIVDTPITGRSITQRVQRIVAERLDIDEASVKAASHLTNDLGADSLDQVEIVMDLEDEFEIEIPDTEAEKFETVQQAIDYITARVPA